jgi:mono/diheme cytochrome c family protein
MARVAFAFLVAVAAGMIGLAMYFGFVPNPLDGRRSASDVVAPEDSVAVAPTAAAPTGTTAAPPPSDSMAAPAADSAGLASATGARSITAADSAAGDALYHGAGRCVGCHGALGEGASTLGPSLRDSVWTSGDGSVAGIERVIANGAPAGGAFRIAMPAYASQLGMPDIARLAAYVYTLSHAGSVAVDTLPTPAVAGNVDAHPTVPAPATLPTGTTTSTPAPAARPSVLRPTVPPPPAPRPRP